MDAPRYTISVTNQTRGWTVTATHGDHPDIDDPDVRVVPTDPFTFAWGFAGDLLPSILDPDRVTVGLWSRTAADQPVIDLGDVITATARLDVAGPVIARIQPSRVTEVSTDLVTGSDWRIRTTLTAVSYLAELAAVFPNIEGSNAFYAHRWGLIGKALGLSIGCPNAWTLPGGMADALPTTRLNPEWTGSSAAEHAAELLASYVPNDVHHTLIPYYGAGYPAGYSYVDQGYVIPPGDPSIEPAVPDPGTLVKLLIVPASRKQTDAFKLPLTFRDDAGELDVISTPGQATPRMPAVSSRYCEVPTTVRRSRDHLVNTVVVKGVNRKSDGSENRPSTYTHTDAASVTARGPITRTVDTQLALRYYVDDPDVTEPLLPHIAPLAATYLAAPGSTLAYKEFLILGEEMPDDVADAVLPYLTPSAPGDGADGRVVRHLTVHSLPGPVRIPDADPSGFITSGQLTIANGQVRYVVNVTPGQPAYPAAPTPITVGEFTAAGYSLLTLPNVEHTLTVADLDLVDA